MFHDIHYKIALSKCNNYTRNKYKCFSFKHFEQCFLCNAFMHFSNEFSTLNSLKYCKSLLIFTYSWRFSFFFRFFVLYVCTLYKQRCTVPEIVLCFSDPKELRSCVLSFCCRMSFFFTAFSLHILHYPFLSWTMTLMYCLHLSK